MSIREIRQKRGMRLEEVAKEVNRSIAWLSRAERGKLPCVSKIDLDALSEWAGERIPAEALINGNTGDAA